MHTFVPNLGTPGCALDAELDLLSRQRPTVVLTEHAMVSQIP
jgi:hypothetical protein